MGVPASDAPSMPMQACPQQDAMSMEAKLDAFEADFEAGKAPYDVMPSVIETIIGRQELLPTLRQAARSTA